MSPKLNFEQSDSFTRLEFMFRYLRSGGRNIKSLAQWELSSVASYGYGTICFVVSVILAALIFIIMKMTTELQVITGYKYELH